MTGKLHTKKNMNKVFVCNMFDFMMLPTLSKRFFFQMQKK